MEVISEEGKKLIFPKDHENFNIPIFREFNFNDSVPVSYRDLYMILNKNFDFSSKDEIIKHLQLLDMITYVKRQKEVLDYAIANFPNDLDEWKIFVNPNIINIKPQYLIKFPEFIDNHLELFSKLPRNYDLKREKLLEFARNNNTEAFYFLFDKSLITDNFLEELFNFNDLKYVKIVVSKGFNDWNLGMYYVAQGGHKELVLFFIDKGANDWDLGMYGAAEGKNKELVDFFIEKGANNWNLGLQGAARGGNKELVIFFIEKGANYWNCGMEGAALGGHKDLVDFFISKGATSWNWGMLNAAKGGYKELVDFFIEKGANDWLLGLQYASEGRQYELIEFFKMKLDPGRYEKEVFNDEIPSE